MFEKFTLEQHNIDVADIVRNAMPPVLYQEALANEVEAAIEKEKANIEFVQIHNDHLQLWVWERGAGRTYACASGASAAVFAVLQEGLMKGDTIRVRLEGGTLWVTWSPGEPIRHRGAVSFVFEGMYSL